MWVMTGSKYLRNPFIPGRATPQSNNPPIHLSIYPYPGTSNPIAGCKARLLGDLLFSKGYYIHTYLSTCVDYLHCALPSASNSGLLRANVRRGKLSPLLG